jgi:2C-methyl-D-erythritol 2,4-cyclodiphosphate synthase
VLLHAITDAVLGAAARRHRQHFPLMIRAGRRGSLDLLARALALVREAGFEVESVDSTVIAERPP